MSPRTGCSLPPVVRAGRGVPEVSEKVRGHRGGTLPPMLRAVREERLSGWAKREGAGVFHGRYLTTGAKRCKIGFY